MIFEHIGLNQINGSLVVLDGVKGASYEEMVELIVLPALVVGLAFILYGQIKYNHGIF